MSTRTRTIISGLVLLILMGGLVYSIKRAADQRELAINELALSEAALEVQSTVPQYLEPEEWPAPDTSASKKHHFGGRPVSGDYGLTLGLTFIRMSFEDTALTDAPTLWNWPRR